MENGRGLIDDLRIIAADQMRELFSFDRPSPRALAITPASLRRRSLLAICLISCSRSIRACQISSGDSLASAECASDSLDGRNRDARPVSCLCLRPMPLPPRSPRDASDRR